MSKIVRVEEINPDSEPLQIPTKQWQNHITITPSVVSDPSFETNGSFKDFFTALLARHDSYGIRRFSLKLQSMAEQNLVNDCLRNVLTRSVLDLELDVMNVKEDYRLPFEVFISNTVVKLKLGCDFVIDMIPNNAFLPALKTMVLDSVRFDNTSGCTFTKLIAACPVLEELVIVGHKCEEWKWSCVVSSRILKRLTLRRPDWGDHDGESYAPISFDTPNLEYFEYFDVLRDEYPVVNFSSLVEAKLKLPILCHGDHYNLTNLIKGLKNVQTMSIGAVDTTQLFDRFRDAVPLFENLLHLSIMTDSEICWDPLLLLLEKSQNLKTLTIEDLHYTYQSNMDPKIVCKCLLRYSFLLSCRIEVLKINQFRGRIGEMVQIKHVLKKLPCVGSSCSARYRLPKEAADHGGSPNSSKSFVQMRSPGQVFLKKLQFVAST